MRANVREVESSRGVTSNFIWSLYVNGRTFEEKPRTGLGRCSKGKTHPKKRSSQVSERLEDPGASYSTFLTFTLKRKGS